jgi:hypothetical protein
VDNPQSCKRCHDERYCNECHSKFPGGDLRIKSHRPGGASGQDYLWTTNHASEARRNLQSCQACHPDGDVCTGCHFSGSVAGNPHPRNWGNIKGVYRDRNPKTCVKCHGPIIP